jgi:hypothetical protein
VKALLTLIVTVHAAIGIGVGVSASSGNLPSTPEYGQPGFKFLADFPGRVTCAVVRGLRPLSGLHGSIDLVYL